MSLDKSKLKELEDNKMICISYTDEFDDVMQYDFVFNDDKIFMDSSHGQLFVANIDDIDVSDIPNWKDIKRWYRRFGANIIKFILENKGIDYKVFKEWYDEDYKLYIGIAETCDIGVDYWIAESNVILSDYI